MRWRAGVSVSRAEPGAGRARASMSSGLTTPRTSRSHSTSPPRPGSRTRSERHLLGSQVSSVRESFVVPRVKLLASKFIYNAQISFPGHRTSLSWEQQQNVLSSLYLFHVKFLPLLCVAWPWESVRKVYGPFLLNTKMWISEIISIQINLTVRSISSLQKFLE